MTWEDEVVDALSRSGIDTIAYLPDSIIDRLIDMVIDDDSFQTIRVAREEEAVSLLTGVWLGGGRGGLICQSSGLANTFNALGSHAKPAQLPFVGFVTRRGDLGEHNYAQVPAGYGLPRMLEAIGVRYHQLDRPDGIGQRVAMGAETSFGAEQPYIFLLERSLTGGKDD